MNIGSIMSPIDIMKTIAQRASHHCTEATNQTSHPQPIFTLVTKHLAICIKNISKQPLPAICMYSCLYEPSLTFLVASWHAGARRERAEKEGERGTLFFIFKHCDQRSRQVDIAIHPCAASTRLTYPARHAMSTCLTRTSRFTPISTQIAHMP